MSTVTQRPKTMPFPGVLSALSWALSQVKSDPLQYIGYALGVVGALTLSFNADYSRNGWLFFLASNFVLIAWAGRRQMYGVMAGQLVFTYTSINGIANSFF